ncbi:metal-dependent amidase/aminoacylase/carboxypeptidase [Aspergillus steynii IBT 23096]|uniref:Peptidase M20 domain-containing protein 2 n=1 Tax=Aspergillus steynii IBT 23096 TaxID=1392250 RepID=A0A2I2G915_9EURO|nr:metal-dependent amidase/aminoacylase/carboxypeptidase [Aspergillus steynii IBT 23096]PLB49375.1 metal-dependent amidase/aminoacylase/carboxypeptidase [Aspergillus steynii IBT 23096]
MKVSQTQTRFIESVQAALQKYDTQLKSINHKIWSNPELAYEEHHAHNAICELFDTLHSQGYEVRRSVYDLPTAFEIEFTHGSGPGSGRVVTFNAEYDALPGIGHACGHNLIATSSIAAFIATCEAVRAQAPADKPLTVRLLGTPAEESGGGKVKLLERGAYRDVDACLMVHPFPIVTNDTELLSIATVVPGGYLANDKVRVTFTGKPAHAAAAPWEGINALDAVVAAYVNIALLRQQILPSQKIHGIIVNGGDRPNVIPMSASVDYYVRAASVKALKPLTEKVVKCFEAAATATGCKVDFEWGISYADLKTNTPICQSYVSAMRVMGHHTVFDNAGKGDERFGGGSTDMGNVSYAVPGFHGMMAIPVDGVNHTPQFTKGAGSPESHRRSIYCAAGMAVVACQVLVDDEFAQEVKADFEKKSED